MTDPIQSIARSLSADISALNAISHNIANLNTPGFRAERPLPGFDSRLGDGTMVTARDLSDGALSQTGRSLDLALRGKGFFVVERDGVPVLMRSGQFRLDAEGQLVNANGDRVLGESGALTLENDAVRVDTQGRLWDGDRSLGRLRLVDVGDPSLLQALPDGGFRYDGALTDWQGKVEQGAIEHANVDPADESIRLMELTRHVESVQRAIAIYDKAMETGVNRLGEN